MAIAKVQSISGASAGSQTSFPQTFGSPNTAGNLLVAVGAVPDTGVGNPTLTDSLGNSWNITTLKDPGSGFFFSLAYVLNCSAGSNTVTLGFSSVAGTVGWSLSLYEFSGVALTSAVDHSDSIIRYVATTTPTTTAFTASQNGALYFAALMTDTDPGSIVKDPAWTQGETPTTYRGDQYLIQSVAASLAADWTTVSARGNWFIYVFLPTGAVIPISLSVVGVNLVYANLGIQHAVVGGTSSVNTSLTPGQITVANTKLVYCDGNGVTRIIAGANQGVSSFTPGAIRIVGTNLRWTGTDGNEYAAMDLQF